MPVSEGLRGLRLFVVEDESLVAMLLEGMLEELGCVVVNVAGSLDQALQSVDSVVAGAHAAILDVNLGGELVYPFADKLAEQQVPFVFATGYGRAGVASRYPGAPVLAKPYRPEDLAAALASVAGARRPLQ
ncbi:MAG: response regulator [Pseudomonadota bacterium]